MLKKTHFKTFNTIKKGPIYRSLFSNGAGFIFHQAESYKTAHVSLNFLAGSMFENEKEYGLAHLVEHLLFKDKKNSKIRELEMLGADVNAYTYKENICVELTCLGRKLEQILPAFLTHFLCFHFSEEEFEREKKTVIQELHEDKDDHETQGIEMLFEKNFSKDIGHPVGGNEKRLRKFTVQDAQNFYKKHFIPQKMFLTIVGGEIDKHRLEKIYKNALEKYTSSLQRQPFRLRGYKTKQAIKTFRSTRKRAMESAIVFYAFDGPKIDADDYYDYVVLDQILFDGLSSLFFVEFREKSSLIYGLDSALNSFAKAGSYIMIFNTQNQRVSLLDKKVHKVLNDLMLKPLAEDKIRHVKTKILDHWESSFDSLIERTEFLVDNEFYQRHDLSIGEMEKKLNKVSGHSIQKLLKRIYQNNEYSKLVFLKK